MKSSEKRNTSQSRELHLVRWNFRLSPYVMVYVFPMFLSLHILPSLFTLFYFIILCHMANIFLADFVLFSVCFFQWYKNVTQTWTHHTCTSTYGIKPLQSYTSTLSLQRTFGHIYFNCRVFIFYPDFMRNQNLNICLDKNWNFRIIKW